MVKSTHSPYSTSFEYLVDMKAAVGKELGLTDWFQVTQEQINSFAELTRDSQWIHIDQEKAAKHSPYGTTVAHGFFILSLASRVCADSFIVKDVSMGVNYGLDKVRIPNATPVGSRLRGRVSLMTYEEIAMGAKYKVKIVFELEGKEKPALVAEFIAQAYTKQ